VPRRSQIRFLPTSHHTTQKGSNNNTLNSAMLETIEKSTLEDFKNHPHVKVVEYPESKIHQHGSAAAGGGGGITVLVASAYFSLKGEDCHTVSLATEEPRLGTQCMLTILLYSYFALC
jgi:hypothetical protein